MLKRIKAKYHHLKYHYLIKKEYYTWRLNNWIKYTFNTTISKQIKNPFSIPIIIISFNQLFYLEQLINFLLKRGFSNIVIIDNNSSYLPLLNYFKELSSNKKITIHQLKENIGHLVFWENKELFERYSNGFYVVTDADIVPFEETPENFMHKFLTILNTNIEITKVGFSLYLDDIPETNPNKKNIQNWEAQFWEKKYNDDFLTSIDTTFALYRPEYQRKESNFLRAVRTNLPYCARHGGWYINPKNLTDEQLYYIKSANNSSSWLTNEKGELINETFKSHYNKEK